MDSFADLAWLQPYPDRLLDEVAPSDHQPDAVVVELFRRGYMRLIDYMIASLKQVPVMARKKNLRMLKGTEGLASAVG